VIRFTPRVPISGTLSPSMGSEAIGAYLPSGDLFVFDLKDRKTGTSAEVSGNVLAVVRSDSYFHE
jgi:hypothetical protein